MLFFNPMVLIRWGLFKHHKANLIVLVVVHFFPGASELITCLTIVEQRRLDVLQQGSACFHPIGKVSSDPDNICLIFTSINVVNDGLVHAIDDMLRPIKQCHELI